MDSQQANLATLTLFWLIVGYSVVLIPAIVTWWLVVQHINSRTHRTGNVPHGVLRLFLRFGPMALLLSAATFLCGFWILFTPEIRNAFNPNLGVPSLALTGIGVPAFMLSMVLWAYSNTPLSTTAKATS
jgi:hypothetical protein